jgi:hypothetical protein
MDVPNRWKSIEMYRFSSTTTTTTTTTTMHPMFQDTEAKSCYSLRSLSMPDEMIDLNGIAHNRHSLKTSETPENVTFEHVHSILYGDSKSNSIYSNAKKFFNKTFDSTYPHTSLTAEIFNSAIQKLDSWLKVQFVVEVGSFTGNSAAQMGSVLKKHYPGSLLLWIDTWLGGQ